MVKTIMWEKGPDYTFERVKAAGLSFFELSQVDMTDDLIDQVLEASQKHGVTVMATSLNYKPLFGAGAKGFDIETDFDQIVAANRRLGVTYVRDSLIPSICIHNEDGYYQAAEDLNRYGRMLQQEGLKLYYHNHHFEFEKFRGKTGFELLVENTDPELVGFEVDVHWIWRAGHDPVAWLKRLSGRIDLVHLKDYRIRFPEGEPSPDLFHREQCIQFAEIGEGNLAMKEIIETAVAGGAVYLPIEQDQTYGRDSFDCIRVSVKNICDMGFADYL